MSTAALSEDVLRQLMRQVGLPESQSADPAQLLRRIDQFGRDEKSQDTRGDYSVDVESESNDGYDTVCDDDDADVDESEVGDDDESESRLDTGRNNNGTQSLRQRNRRLLRSHRADDKTDDPAGQDNGDEDKDTAEVFDYAPTTAVAAADGMESLQLRMDGVVMSVIEGLRGAVRSLLKLHERHNSADDLGACLSLTPLVPPTPLTLSSLKSLNVSSNCRRGSDRKGICSRKVKSPETKPLVLMPPPPPIVCSSVGDRAKRLLFTQDSRCAGKIDQRWNRRQLQQQDAAGMPTADRLTRRLESLELLLLSLMNQSGGVIDEKKQETLIDLKRSLGCLQAQLLQLQAQELSRGVQGQHRRLDQTWNIRRDWRAVPRALKRAPDDLLACAAADEPSPRGAPVAAAPGNRPSRRDRWLLKFLPRAQRRALPQLMRTVDTRELVGSSAAAVAAATASALTRARGRPLMVCRHLRDRQDDVIRKFVYALQP